MRDRPQPDTRTATEYGVVRTFFDATLSWTTGGYSGKPAATYEKDQNSLTLLLRAQRNW